MAPRLYLLAPEVVLAASIAMPTASYPLDELTFDNVTSGDYQDVMGGMTVALYNAAGVPLGRQRARKPAISGTLFVGRSSQGLHDGELWPVDNATFEVWADYRVWNKVPVFATDGSATMYKDSDIAVGDYGSEPPPVANAGAPVVATIDGSDIITVDFDADAASYAVADGASISSYIWDVDDGTITVGTANTAAITATFPAGVRYVRLTVIDSNSKSHACNVPVIALDPADDPTIPISSAAIRGTKSGYTATIETATAIPESTYPDGTLAILFDGEPSAADERDNLLFWGWHQSDPADIRSGRTGTISGTTLECVDVAGRLTTLRGYSVSVENEAHRDSTKFPATTWNFMSTPNMDKLVHYILQWHTTALEVADFVPSGTGSDFPFLIRTASESDVYSQVNRLCNSMVPDYWLTQDKTGTLRMRADALLQRPQDRTYSGVTLGPGDYSNIRWTGQRPPRVSEIETNAVLATTTDTLTVIKCRAPGNAPGQGLTVQVRNESLARNQSTLNITEGYRYARTNAPYSYFALDLANDHGIDPALIETVLLNLPSSIAAQRGLTFENEVGIVHEIVTRYEATRTGVTRSVQIQWERGGLSTDAVTVIPDASSNPPDDGGYWPPGYLDNLPGGLEPIEFVPPLPGDPEYFYGDMQAYILWDGAHVMRTWDIQASSPTWELVDTGITGTVLDGQYVHVDAVTVGMWLLTSDAVWWCADIMATTPVWDDVLTIATVRATEDQIGDVSNPSVFYGMYAYASEPGFLIVGTCPQNQNTSGNTQTYGHAYSWHTHDYGQSWTTVDMDAFTDSSAYAWGAPYSIAIYASSPTIWMWRCTSTTGGGSSVFKSDDGGHTWTQEFTTASANRDVSLLAPFPDIDGPSYGAQNNTFYVSTDEWDTASAASAPAGYGSVIGKLRPNSNTFDPDHVINYWANGADASLFDSDDQGANWTEVHDTDRSVPQVQTPNGWPPDTNVWVDIRITNSSGVAAEVIRYTADKFATATQDKRGNLAALIGDWSGSTFYGAPNGFALPRVGDNA